jgi:5-methylthioadenosine/S-adenosylhomocysteine deaminase
METVIRNATVVTGDVGRTVLYDHALAVRDDRIDAVGPSEEIIAAYPEADIINGRGKAIFPGLINCHTHLLATLDRGVLEDFGFPTRLRFPVTARSLLTKEERQVMAVLGALEALRSGTTSLLEISGNVAMYASPLERTGLRLVLAENINDVDESGVREGVCKFSNKKLDSGLQRSADLIEKWHGTSEGRVTCFVAPHAPETCSPQLLKKSRDLAEKYGTGYTIHLSQSRIELEVVKRTRGVSPTHYLFANDFLGPRLVAAHCRYVDASEVALLGQMAVGISNNAAIAARRGAAPPIKELQAAGCLIGMGSDNMAEDMIEVMRAGLFLERVRRNDEIYPQPEDVLQWATRGGASLLGMERKVGSLEPGKKADLFMVNLHRPHLVPTLRVVSAFVHNGQPTDIESVMVDGQWLMWEGKVLTIDESDIIQQAERIGHAVWQRLVQQYPGVPFPLSLPPGPVL